MTGPTTPDLRRYRERGYAVVRGVLDGATVDAARAHLDDLRRRIGVRPDAAIVTAPLETEPFFATLAVDDRLVAIAGVVLGSAVEAFGCTYLVKAPRVGLPVLWHQDGEPWRTGHGITDAATLWIALDPATSENGCLRVIPGSHRAEAQPLIPATDVPNVFGVASAPSLVDESIAVDVPMTPGDVSVHHPALVHGSGPNRSDEPRAALAVRYASGRVA